MDKTKKNGILKAAACVFGSTMLMTCVLGGTLAKYVTTEKEANASFTAAKWDVQLNGEPWDTASFDNLSITDIHSSTSGSAEIPTKPAPGTWGYEAITIKNNSEVAAKITVTQGSGAATDVSNSGLSLAVFTGTDPTSGSDITGNLGTLATDGVVIEPQSEQVVYVGYNWEFDSSKDSGDTALAGQKITFDKLTLKAEQAEHKAI